MLIPKIENTHCEKVVINTSSIPSSGSKCKKYSFVPLSCTKIIIESPGLEPFPFELLFQAKQSPLFYWRNIPDEPIGVVTPVLELLKI